MQHTTERARTFTMRFEPGADNQSPFRRSLGLILRAALEEFNASGVFLYELVQSDTLMLRSSSLHGAGGSERLSSANLDLSPAATAWLLDLRQPELTGQSNLMVSDYPEVLLHQLQQLVVVPLREGGVLHGIVTIGWRHHSMGFSLENHSAELRRLCAILSSLLNRAREANAAIYLAKEVATLESELIDGKIADRALGVLTAGSHVRRPLDAIEGHVERVLGGPFAATELRRQMSDLQALLQDRRLLIQAKGLLQKQTGLSEEEAYRHLRNESRRTRRPLREIASSMLTDTAQVR